MSKQASNVTTERFPQTIGADECEQLARDLRAIVRKLEALGCSRNVPGTSTRALDWYAGRLAETPFETYGLTIEWTSNLATHTRAALSMLPGSKVAARAALLASQVSERVLRRALESVAGEYIPW